MSKGEAALIIGELGTSWEPGSPWGSWGLVAGCAFVAMWLTGSVRPSVSRARALYPKLTSRRTLGEGADGEAPPRVGVGRWCWPARAVPGGGWPYRAVAVFTPPDPSVPGLRSVSKPTIVIAGTLAGGVLVALWQESPLPLFIAPGAALLARRWLGRRARHRAAERREAAVIELCAGVAAELRAGRQPHEALLAVGTEGLGPADVGVSAAARFGGDVPRAFRRASLRPGCEGLGGVAACWQVTAEGGAGLADGLDRVASALRGERDQREDLRAQLAGPRATAVILATLPLLGLLMGTAMGADPLAVLLHSPIGWVLLLGALTLEGAGVAWVSWLVRKAEGDVSGVYER